MGRTFESLSGKHVARVTGLDPAGPLFVRNAYGLKKHMIGKDSGTFVDIIHSNGDFDPYAFPAYLCPSAGLCSEGRKTNEEVGNHMGEFATKPMQGSRKLYYLDVTTDYGHL